MKSNFLIINSNLKILGQKNGCLTYDRHTHTYFTTNIGIITLAPQFSLTEFWA